MACLGVLSKRKATLGNTRAETEIGERRCHNVERNLVGRGVLGKKRQEFEDFNERARPYNNVSIFSTRHSDRAHNGLS